MFKKVLLTTFILGFSISLHSPVCKNKAVTKKSANQDYLKDVLEFLPQEKHFANYYLNLVFSLVDKSKKETYYLEQKSNLISFLKKSVEVFKAQGESYQDPRLVCLFIKGVLLPIDEQEFLLYPKLLQQHGEKLVFSLNDDYKNILLKNSKNFVTIFLTTQQEERFELEDFSQLNRFYFNMQKMLNSEGHDCSGIHFVRFLAKLVLSTNIAANQDQMIKLFINMLVSLAKINQRNDLILLEHQESIFAFLNDYLAFNKILSSSGVRYDDFVFNQEDSSFKEDLIRKWSALLVFDSQHQSKNSRRLEFFLLNNKNGLLRKIITEFKLCLVTNPAVSIY